MKKRFPRQVRPPARRPTSGFAAQRRGRDVLDDAIYEDYDFDYPDEATDRLEPDRDLSTGEDRDRRFSSFFAPPDDTDQDADDSGGERAVIEGGDDTDDTDEHDVRTAADRSPGDGDASPFAALFAAVPVPGDDEDPEDGTQEHQGEAADDTAVIVMPPEDRDDEDGRPDDVATEQAAVDGDVTAEVAEGVEASADTDESTSDAYLSPFAALFTSAAVHADDVDAGDRTEEHRDERPGDVEHALAVPQEHAGTDEPSGEKSDTTTGSDQDDPTTVRRPIAEEYASPFEALYGATDATGEDAYAHVSTDKSATGLGATAAGTAVFDNADENDLVDEHPADGDVVHVDAEPQDDIAEPAQDTAAVAGTDDHDAPVEPHEAEEEVSPFQALFAAAARRRGTRDAHHDIEDEGHDERDADTASAAAPHDDIDPGDTADTDDTHPDEHHTGGTRLPDDRPAKGKPVSVLASALASLFSTGGQRPRRAPAEGLTGASSERTEVQDGPTAVSPQKGTQVPSGHRPVGYLGGPDEHTPVSPETGTQVPEQPTVVGPETAAEIRDEPAAVGPGTETEVVDPTVGGPAGSTAVAAEPPARTPDEPTEGPDQPTGDRHSFWVRDALLIGCLALVVALSILYIVRPIIPHNGSGSATGGTSTTQTARPGAAAVPQPPPAAPEVGSYVESRIGANGDVLVRQWIRSPKALSGIRLEVPVVPGGSKIRATGLSVAADRSAVAAPKVVGASGRQLHFDKPAKAVYVRYTLHGVVERSPSVPGRALARLTMLHVGYSPRTGPSLVTLLNAKVLSTACASTPSAVPRPCGAPEKGAWRVVLHGADRSDAVMAQVNLS
jgi:hypothetical protein